MLISWDDARIALMTRMALMRSIMISDIIPVPAFQNVIPAYVVNILFLTFSTWPSQKLMFSRPL